MDYTPKTDIEDANNTSTSINMFDSTPKVEAHSTPCVPHFNPKKRKVQHCELRSRKLHSLLESSPSTPTPQASSTLNDSLTKEFGNIKLEQNYFQVGCCKDEPALKFFKTNSCDKIVTPPNTPEALPKSFDSTPKKLSSFHKSSVAPSPFKEQHEILYPTLKPLEPLRKPLTPQKFKEKLEKNARFSTPLKPVYITKEKDLVSKVLRNDVIMGHVFKYLSNGDLFRVSMASREFREALIKNKKASDRFLLYRESHKKNKENYKITPPSSPECQSIFPEGSVSPNSQNFADFIELGSNLSLNQSLIKCPKCTKPSVVEKSIAQCQDINVCGYIYCQKCDSFAYGPQEFYDKCRGLALGNSTKTRGKLEDLSNYSDMNLSSVLNSIGENHYSSGYFSGYESSRSPISVKRNLSKSFGRDDSSMRPQKALFDCNRSSSFDVKYKEGEKKNKSSTVVVAPVVQTQVVRKKIEMVEPSSPPKIKSYTACSKHSKRQLKRLTR